MLALRTGHLLTMPTPQSDPLLAPDYLLSFAYGALVGRCVIIPFSIARAEGGATWPVY